MGCRCDRILRMLENAIDEHNTSRVTQRERLRCPSPEDTVDNNPVEDGVLSSCSSLSSVAGERDDKEKRGQGDDKHEDKENRKDEANEERVENGKEEGEEKEKYERRHGEEEEGGAEGAEMGEDQKTGEHKADVKKDGQESVIESWERASAAAMALAKVTADVTATIAAFPSAAFSTTEVQEDSFVFLNMDSTLVWDGGDLL